MAVALINKNYNTSYCVFSFDNWSTDKVFLPDLRNRGKGDLSSIPPISQGSKAYGIDGTSYILNGNNQWVPYSGNSGSGFIDLNGDDSSTSPSDSSDGNGFVDLEEMGV